MSNPSVSPSDICPTCHSVGTVEYREAEGQTICTSCCSVLEENGIVSSIEFNDANAGPGSTVVGTFVGPNMTKAYSSNGRGRSRYGGYTKGDSREATMKKAKQSMQRIGTSLQINSQYQEEAMMLYRMALNSTFVMGRRSLTVVAVCLYTVCRYHNTAHMLIDFSDAVSTNVFVLGAAYMKLREILHYERKVIDPSIYVSRFSVQLEFPEGQKEAIDKLAVRLVASMKRDWLLEGRRPTGLCGASLFLASHALEHPRRLTDVAVVVRCHPTTIAKRLQEFSQTPAAHMQLKQFLMYGIEEFKREGKDINGTGSSLPIAVDPPAYTRNKIREVELEFHRKQEQKLKQKKGRKKSNPDKENENEDNQTQENDTFNEKEAKKKEELMKAYKPLYLARRKQTGKARREAEELRKEILEEDMPIDESEIVKDTKFISETAKEGIKDANSDERPRDSIDKSTEKSPNTQTTEMEPYASNESPSTSSMLSNQSAFTNDDTIAMKTKEMVTEILKDSKGQETLSNEKKGSEDLEAIPIFQKVGEEILKETKNFDWSKVLYTEQQKEQAQSLWKKKNDPVIKQNEEKRKAAEEAAKKEGNSVRYTLTGKVRKKYVSAKIAKFDDPEEAKRTMQSRIKKHSRKINYDALTQETDKEKGRRRSYIRGPNIRINVQEDETSSDQNKLTKLEMANIDDFDSGYSDSGRDMQSNTKLSRKRKRSLTNSKDNEEHEESNENDNDNESDHESSQKKYSKIDPKQKEQTQPISEEEDEDGYDPEDEKLMIARAHREIESSVADLYNHDYDEYGDDYAYDDYN